MVSGFCWRCAVETIDGASFCHCCGAPLAAQPQPKTRPISDPSLSQASPEPGLEVALPNLIADRLGTTVRNLLGRFKTTGWRYQGLTDIGCYECDTDYHVFRKPYTTSKGGYEYWAIVCTQCRTCVGIDVMDAKTTRMFREWASSLTSQKSARGGTKGHGQHQKPHNSDSESEPSHGATHADVGQKGSRPGFSPTDEQIAIIEGAKHDTDIAVEALAGTGKTTTLKLLADSKVGLTGTYVAFNRSIVDEARAKFPSRVRCSTAHGLAYQAIGREYASRLQSTQRLSFKQIAAWLEAGAFGFKSSISNHVLDPAQMAQHAQATVRNFCKSIDSEISAKHVKIPVIIGAHSPNAKAFARAVVPLAKKIWADLLLDQGFMKFAHDHYLKMWQLGKPTIGSDFILFDEAQDADPVMLDVVNSQSSSQLIYVGDQYQAIYEWRGAKNALSMVNVDEHLWLTQSFRFGPSIASQANKYLRLLNAPKMVRGFGEIDSDVRELANPDAILCRTNAGVMSAIMGEQTRNRLVSIIGRPEELIGFAEACQQLISGVRTGHPELAPFLNWEGVRDFVDEYPDEAQEIRTMVKLVEGFGTQRLISALHELVPEDQADVVISTAHRAKGREWNDVRLESDFLHTDDMDDEDLRLAYVAITRAKRTLDKTSWETISPRSAEEPSTSEPFRFGRKRPALSVKAKPSEEKRKGIVSRIRTSKKPEIDWADRI